MICRVCEFFWPTTTDSKVTLAGTMERPAWEALSSGNDAQPKRTRQYARALANSAHRKKPRQENEEARCCGAEDDPRIQRNYYGNTLAAIWSGYRFGAGVFSGRRYRRSGVGANSSRTRDLEDSGDETATYANGVVAELASPYRFETDSHGRKNWDMEDGKQSRRNLLLGGKVQGYAAETKINDPCAVCGLVAQDGIGVRSRHRDALRFSRYGVDPRLIGHGGKIGFCGL